MEWPRWCRLCAKENSENNINILSCNVEYSATEETKITLKEALEKYFWVQSSIEDILPKNLCCDCYSLVSSLILFNERVERVQQMYNFLIERPLQNSYDLKTIRLKFDVSDDDRMQWHPQLQTIPNVTGTDGGIVKLSDIQNTHENEASFTISIKEEIIYDGDCVANDSHGEEEDPFETMTGDYEEKHNVENTEGHDFEMEDYVDESESLSKLESPSCNEPSKRERMRTIPNATGTDAGIVKLSDIQNTHANEASFAISIKEETSTSYGDVDQEEIIHDGDSVAKDFHGEEEYPFETMTVDYEEKHNVENSEGHDFEMEDDVEESESLSKLESPSCNDNAEPSKTERMRSKIKDINCKKKEINTDFLLNGTCKECGENFRLYSTCCEHMKEKHGNDNKQWKCPSCDRILPSWYNFKRHLRIHMPVEQRKTKECNECDARFTTKTHLEAHINYMHKNPKPFICEECGLCFSTNSNLRQHMLTHTDIKPFECEVCKKKFKNNSRLKIHMDTHSSNKHVCTICGLQLNSRATLNHHFLVHSEDMQHKCDYCGRAFKRPKTLKTHLLLHTGLKPYSCDFCDRAFASGTNSRSHMKKVHPEELAALEASGNKTPAKNIPKLETLKAVTKAADNLDGLCV